MATPTLTRHTIDGALGPILVDLRAADRSTPRPAVVVLHGFKGFKDWGMFPPFADRLARAGFSALAFNMSGSGVDEAGTFAHPERFGRNTFSAELTDLTVVLDALTTGRLGIAPPTSIGLVGHSRGGGIAVLQAAHDPRVGALATWAAIASVERWPAAERAHWRTRGRLDVVNTRTGDVLPLYPDVLDDIEQHTAALDIAAAAAQVAVPWLIVHGALDEAVDVREGEALAAAAPKRLAAFECVEGAGHTFGAAHPWNGGSPALEQVFDRTFFFLARALV